LLSQLRAENLTSALRKLASSGGADPGQGVGSGDGVHVPPIAGADDEDVPDLVENFDEASKAEIV